MAKSDEVVAHLGEVPLFSRCSKKELRTVAQSLDVREVADGARLVRQGEAGDSFFVLIEGSAVVRRNGRKLASLEPGDFFGELAVLDPAPRNADVVAQGAVTVGALDVRAFRSLLRALPAMNERLLAGLARRVREADRKSVE